MGKRVGITTNTKERKEHWEGRYSTLKNWRIVESGLTYKQAQKKENEYIARGYTGHPGGEEKPGNGYSVYAFDY